MSQHSSIVKADASPRTNDLAVEVDLEVVQHVNDSVPSVPPHHHASLSLADLPEDILFLIMERIVGCKCDVTKFTLKKPNEAQLRHFPALLVRLARHFPHLVSLESEPMLFQNLRKFGFTISGEVGNPVPNVTMRRLPIVAPKLQVLDVYVPKIHPDMIYGDLAQFATTLRELTIGMEMVGEMATLTGPMPRFPALHELTAPAAVLDILGAAAPQLRSLVLNKILITSRLLDCLVAAVPALTTLKLVSCPRLWPSLLHLTVAADYKPFLLPVPFLATVPHLKTLNLDAYEVNWTDRIVQTLPSLTSLSTSTGCLRSLADRPVTLHRLVELTLSNVLTEIPEAVFDTLQRIHAPAVRARVVETLARMPKLTVMDVKLINCDAALREWKLVYRQGSPIWRAVPRIERVSGAITVTRRLVVVVEHVVDVEKAARQIAAVVQWTAKYAVKRPMPLDVVVVAETDEGVVSQIGAMVEGLPVESVTGRVVVAGGGARGGVERA
ncbi:hypothetical protein GGF32_008475 [Allomyces javanicus]|nr:hypothetical protein GGF32_008475 [Allomyces javanicus]